MSVFFKRQRLLGSQIERAKKEVACRLVFYDEETEEVTEKPRGRVVYAHFPGELALEDPVYFCFSDDYPFVPPVAFTGRDEPVAFPRYCPGVVSFSVMLVVAREQSLACLRAENRAKKKNTHRRRSV